MAHKSSRNMPRQKNVPLRALDKVGAQFGGQVNLQELYIKSKKQDEFFIKVPAWNTAGDDIELLLLRTRNERDLMDKEQSDLVETNEYNARINLERANWAKITMSGLRKQFIEVNDFVKDCSDKRITAKSAIGTQLEIQKKLHHAIAVARHDVQELSAFQKIFAEHINEYKWCHEFMKKILTESDMFESEHDCMSRCDALMSAQESIRNMRNIKLREIEEMRLVMVQTAKEAAAIAMGMANKMEVIRRDYMQARLDCQHWEKKLEDAVTHVFTNHVHKSREIDSIAHLYRVLCGRIGANTKYNHRVEDQLDFIKNEVEVMTTVLEEIRRRGYDGDEEQAHGPGC